LSKRRGVDRAALMFVFPRQSDLSLGTGRIGPRSVCARKNFAWAPVLCKTCVLIRGVAKKP